MQIVDMSSPPSEKSIVDLPLDTDITSSSVITTVSNTPSSMSHSRLSPVSTISNPDFGPLSPHLADRVFPIRSVINIESRRNSPSSPGGTTRSSMCSTPGVEVEPSPTFKDANRCESLSGRSESVNDRDTGSFYTCEGVLTSEPDSGVLSQKSNAEPETVPLGEFYTARHKHIESNDGHMIVTGINGSEKIQRCEDEPIHIPGAVQGFGCLIAFHELDDGILDIRIVSENSRDIIGFAPHELFQRGDLCTILSDEQTENVFDHIDFVRDDTDPKVDGPEVFSMNVTGRDSVQIKLWCAMHVPDPENRPDFYICEFELEDDLKFPLSDSSEDANLPGSPEDTLGSDPTKEELLDSTTSTNRPLRVLRHARKRKGEAAALEVFNLMGQIQEQLASATHLEEFLKVVVGLIKEMTGFHRVMIYQFDEAWNGRVVTELVDPRATKDLYKGLHFPASDIPAQARQLYRLNKVRLLYDRDQPTARLICKEEEDLKTPLDLTHSYLRAMSPIHIKYLKNMAVRASMSISITAFDQLWGLVSCHNYGQKGMRVSFPIRKMCQLIGETASRNIERLSYARRLHARKLINTIPTEQNPGGYIVASSDDLLKLFDADCGLVSIKDETKVLGKLDNTQEALVMLEYLRMKTFTTVLTSQDLTQDFPDLNYLPCFQGLAGMLLVPLSSGGEDFIVFFRGPQLKSVHWAGNPYEKKMKAGTDAYLEPRESFKIWSETIVGKSRDWTEEQIETAAVLCLVYGKFIEVWRQKEAALKNSQLTRLLLSNASHEVRTPLNAIINYLEIALESPLDKDTRDNLSKSHSASKSLIYVINDLLDLTRTEGGWDLVKDEVFDVRQILYDATTMFKADSKRKGIGFEIVEYDGLPTLLKGDPSRIRQIISNITANAVKHTTEGGIRMEIWATHLEDGKCELGFAVQDTGSGISPKKLDTLFREFEQVHPDDEVRSAPTTAEEMLVKTYSKESESEKILGLGLAVVARSIRNMNGQLRLKSEEGKGSKFIITIPLKILESKPIELTRESTPSPVHIVTMNTNSPPKDAQEVTLIQPHRTTISVRPSVDTMRYSSGENDSATSTGSGRSEIDRLVDAISSPSPAGGMNPRSKPMAGAMLSPSGPPMQRSISPGNFDQPPLNIPGQANINGSVAPVKPLKVQEEEVDVPAAAAKYHIDPKAATQTATPSISIEFTASQTMPPTGDDLGKFVVLVAEDDPINSKIIKKRLEKIGHEVVMTLNGKECLDVFCKTGDRYDAILMDIQMPIMDGGTSTENIRRHEAENNHEIPQKRLKNGRIPIFAVSASLLEEQKSTYCDQGFDGWVLKPIDFKRLEKILHGIRDAQTRKEEEYVPMRWERGGWFFGEKNEGVEDMSAAAVQSGGSRNGDV